MKRILSVIITIVVIFNMLIPEGVLFAADTTESSDTSAAARDEESSDTSAAAREEGASDISATATEAGALAEGMSDASSTSSDNSEYVPGELIVVFKNKGAFRKAESIIGQALSESDGMSENAELSGCDDALKDKALDDVSSGGATDSASDNGAADGGADGASAGDEASDGGAADETGAENNAGDIELEIISNEDKAVLVGTSEETDIPQLCTALEETRGVEYAQPNYYYTLDAEDDTVKTIAELAGGVTAETGATINDPLIGEQWSLDYMDVPEAWNLIDELRSDWLWQKSQHKRVKVAVLDTGTNTGHEDLSSIYKGGNIDTWHCVTVKHTGKSDAGEDTYNAVRYTLWNGGHGTHTASVIAATSNNGSGVAGIAAGNGNDIIELMSIDVFPAYDKDTAYPRQRYATTADVVAGIDYAAENGAGVISMCLGHKWNSVGEFSRHDDEWLHEKIKWAVNEKDVVIVCSAGNNSKRKAWYPSDFEEVISCINTTKYKDIDSSKCKSASSNYGPKKDISAPGTMIVMADSGACMYTRASGTSFSAPAVAAVAALVRYVNPALTQEEVKTLLYRTTVDLYKTGYDEITGWGNVNAYNAVSAAAGLNERLEAAKLATPELKAKRIGKQRAKHRVKLTWKNDSTARKYYVYKSTKADGSFKRVAVVTNGSGKYTTKKAARKKYYYKIMASGTTRDGKRTTSDYSNVISM